MVNLFKRGALYGSTKYKYFKELEAKTLTELKEIAKVRGIYLPEDASKKEIISTLANNRGD